MIGVWRGERSSTVKVQARGEGRGEGEVGGRGMRRRTLVHSIGRRGAPTACSSSPSAQAPTSSDCAPDRASARPPPGPPHNHTLHQRHCHWQRPPEPGCWRWRRGAWTRCRCRRPRARASWWAAQTRRPAQQPPPRAPPMWLGLQQHRHCCWLWRLLRCCRVSPRSWRPHCCWCRCLRPQRCLQHYRRPRRLPPQPRRRSWSQRRCPTCVVWWCWKK